MSAGLEKYTKRPRPSRRPGAAKMTIIDDDCVAAYSADELARLRGATNIVGFGESKVGGWDDPTDTAAPPAAELATSSSSDSDADADAAAAAGEAKFAEFQRQMDASAAVSEKAKSRCFAEDPLVAIRRRTVKAGEEDRPIAGPPNRFGIAPGGWWDGIDRSNGFERKRFEMIGQRDADTLRKRREAVSDL
jgi:pre-mRNA-splicing factor CWC26